MITVMAPSVRKGPYLRFLLLIFHFILFLPLPFSVDAAELLRPVPERHICKSLDIRNNLKAFDQLEECQVIEGSLQILLFDSVNETDFLKKSFPNLVEISDYLLLFRVNGLKSLGHLFPNLTVIRGQNQFPGGKSLIIFEMPSLQELNLYSLTHVGGKIHIDKNPSLCFVKSINWNKISNHTDHVFAKSFKPDNECPVCPARVNGIDCPRNTKDNKYYCWNREHCQKICAEENCYSCNDKGQCCDEACLGGCGTDTTKCSVCRHYVLNVGANESKCVEDCPYNHLVFFQRRCVTQDECKSMVRPLDFEEVDTVTNTIPETPYKVHEGECRLNCPSNYFGNYSDHSCTMCNNTCRKECNGVRIDNVDLVDQLRGCTHIKGNLEIQIRGEQVVKTLEDNLGMVEEIDGYLKVVRSFSLVSLNFLKNLKKIHGNTLESQRYSLVVLDNQNLQDLFDWSKHKELQIEHGRLFFHFNPKLCMDKIETLIKKTHLPEHTEMEVASNSNGDKVACNVTKLEVNITSITSKSVMLHWKPFELEDPRKLLSYVIYFKESRRGKNVSFYDGRDACGQDNWHVDDVPNNVDLTVVSHPLINLKPFTVYAFFIKTYTIASERRGAQSDMMYFTTKPSQPSEPSEVNVEGVDSNSNSLLIRWQRPRTPNGKITYYIIYGIKHHDDPLPKNRDYCRDAVKPENDKTSTVSPIPKDEKCKKPIETGTKVITERNEVDEQARIDFENALHNKVYVRRQETSDRSRRSIGDDLFIDRDMVNSNFWNSVKIPDYLLFDNTTIPMNTTEPRTTFWNSFAYQVEGLQHELTVDNLRHFATYDVLVWACRDKEQDDPESNCGEPSHMTGKTRAKVGADNITNVTVVNTTSSSVTINWAQPLDPNRQIVAVNIFYKREDSQNSQVSKVCISFRDFKNYSDDRFLMHTITELFPGNYSLYMQATSIYGAGAESKTVVFYIAPSGRNVILIVCLILVFITLIVILAAGLYYKKIQKDRIDRLIPLINPDYVSNYVVDDWEVPRKNVTSIRELGQGSFGMVYEGLGHDLKGYPGKTRCAVKTVNENATARERIEFLNEASVMKAFNTTHVVKLLGVVSQGQPALVIMELMAHGDLKTYLRLHRPENQEGRVPPSIQQLLRMALEIADGMAYLEGKKFVHRDLAARNCMVAEDLTVKIGDFGMTRDIYETDYYRKGSRGLLPVRWMAPESLKDGVFSSSSDAFSYGVVLWEMATLASQPYQGLSNEQVLRYVMEGGVMSRPENCSDQLYDLMLACWDKKPGRRPTFMDLCERLLPYASAHFHRVSFYNSEEGAEVRAIRASASSATTESAAGGDGDDADASTPLNALPPDLRIVGGEYATSASERSDSVQSVHVDPNPKFYSVSEDRTANGYAGQARNGKAQSQC